MPRVEDDPFAPVPDPADEPAPDPWAGGAPIAGRAPAVERDVVTGEFGLSAKFGRGYEAPMLHVKARDLYTLAAMVGYEYDPDARTRDVLKGVSKFWTSFANAVQRDYAPAEGGAAPAPIGRTPSGANRAPSGGGQRRQQPARIDFDTSWMYDESTPPQCEHGEWKPVTKEGSRGRWFAWGCPGDKRDQCSDGLEFVNKPK